MQPLLSLAVSFTTNSIHYTARRASVMLVLFRVL